MLLVVVFTLNTALVSSLPSTFFCLNISVPRCGLVHQDSLFLAFRRRLMRAIGLRFRPRDILRRARACTSSMNSYTRRKQDMCASGSTKNGLSPTTISGRIHVRHQRG